jgi:phosphoglucosamine mutase
VLSDFATTGDGLVSALQVHGVCATNGAAGFSEVCRRFEPVPQVLKNVRHSGGNPLDDAHVKAAIADAESTLGNAARLVIRPSGTEPLIRVMAEGDDRTQIETVVDQLINVISRDPQRSLTVCGFSHV